MTSSGDCLRILQRPEISPSLCSFLDTNFHNRDDLFNAHSLETQLLRRCSDLDRDVSDLHERISSLLVSYADHSGRIGEEIGRIKAKLGRHCPILSTSDGSEDSDVDRNQKIFAEELPALAKEVTRIETVRAYAETALKLDALVGDIEDAVFSAMQVNLRKPQTSKSEDVWLLAINSLKSAEDILTSIMKSRPKWTCLVSAVDRRVDRAFSILRPHVIADHRVLLTSLGWPPPLVTTKSVNPDHEKGSKLSNPLLVMHGHIKSNYCDNFLALCCLQELQMRRKARMLVGHNREIALHQPLWAIEELVNPIASASEKHFSKWIDKPEFIFALSYRITRDFVESMDELLQPLVDMARLKGYCCREEWISAMVISLVTHLEKEIFPVYLARLENIELAIQFKDSWLHLIDLMIDFDKRMHSLIASTGLLASLREDESLRRVSSMSVFCDRPDWLEIWAEIETKDILDKLMPEFENEKSWRMLIQRDLALSGSENCTAPIISASVHKCLTLLVDRCRPLPDTYLCERFIKLTCSQVLDKLTNCLLQRCQEAEGLTALADDDAMIKVANCVNAARYFELVLLGWCEDVFFLEMRSEEEYENVGPLLNCVFCDDIERLKGFRTEWAAKLSTVVQRGFDAQCRDYIKNKRQWQEVKWGDTSSVSPSLIDALDYLHGKIAKLGGALNEMDFVTVWRSIAGGVDHLLFNGIFMSNAKFSDDGVKRFGVDFDFLLRILRPFCLRPQGFFPRLSEVLCVLKLEESVGRELMGSENKARWLKEHSIVHVGVAQAEKLIKLRIYGA